MKLSEIQFLLDAMKKNKKKINTRLENFFSKTNKFNLILLPFLLVFATFSFVIFSVYKPQTSKDTQEVKGMQDESILLPKLLNAELVSQANNSNTQAIILQTEMEPQKVIDFYTIALQKKGWEVDSKGDNGDTFSTKYKNGKDVIIVTAAKQGAEQVADKNLTLVNIEVSDN